MNSNFDTLYETGASNLIKSRASLIHLVINIFHNSEKKSTLPLSDIFSDVSHNFSELKRYLNVFTSK